MDSLPAWVARTLRRPATAMLARLALTAAFWIGGLQKLLDFPAAVAEQAHFGLPAPALMAALTIAVELLGSVLVVSGWLAWLGAGALAVFTALATLIAHRFWDMAGMERFMAMNSFFEHVGLIGGLVLAAALAQRARGAPAAQATPTAAGAPVPVVNSPTPATAAPGSALLAPMLSFVAGFVDTVGFLALLGLFTAHVTGNFVVIGATLVDHPHGLVAKLLALPVFIAGVGLSKLLARQFRAEQRAGMVVLLAVQGLLLCGFLLSGLLASPVTDADAPAAVLAGLVGVLAMAVQNAASRTVFAALSPTTVMTGNVTQLTLDAVDLLTGLPGGERDATTARLRKMALPVLGFALGAVLGGVGFVHAGFGCLLLPIVAVGAMACQVGSRRHANQPV